VRQIRVSVPYWTGPPVNQARTGKTQELVNREEKAIASEIVGKSQTRRQISGMRRVGRESEPAKGRPWEAGDLSGLEKLIKVFFTIA